MDALPARLAPALRQRALAAAAWVRERAARGQAVLVVHHIDADGVTAGAIAATALERAGVAHRTLAVKSMDQVHQDLVRAQLGPTKMPQMPVSSSASSAPSLFGEGGAPALWFCDLGSTVYMEFPDAHRLVCDHHQLVRDGSEESFPHVNPLLDGLSGEEVSGAGCAYLVAAALDARNLDLLPLALVGATADLQDRKGGFHGTNALLLAHGEALGLLRAERDLAFFGPETRPLRKFLALAEPKVPTATGDQRSAERFLLGCGIELTRAGVERTWSGLDDGERRHVRSALVQCLLDAGLAERVPALARTVVRIDGEVPGAPTRELQEFGTLLNGTARYGRPEIGLAVARGDRGAAYDEALGLLLDHRKHLASALDAFAQQGVSELLAVQWVHLQDRVLDTVVGIVCGMALEALGLRRDRVVLAFAWTPDGRTKVSTRSPHELQARGIDLATALREAAAALGGQGGGHKGAAGATIPRGAEPDFVAHVDRLLAAQLGIAAPAAPPPVPGTASAPAAGLPETLTPLAVPFLRARGAQTRLAL